MSSEQKEMEEDPMIGDILSSIKSIINEDEKVEDEKVEDEEELELETDPEPDPEPEPEPGPEPKPDLESMFTKPTAPEMIDDDFENSIISSSTAEIGAQQFVKLNNMIRMGNSNVTLSDIVRSLLRPMLREWLDENLPAMVEQKVEYEIKRLVNRVEDN